MYSNPWTHAPEVYSQFSHLPVAHMLALCARSFRATFRTLRAHTSTRLAETARGRKLPAHHYFIQHKVCTRSRAHRHFRNWLSGHQSEKSPYDEEERGRDVGQIQGGAAGLFDMDRFLTCVGLCYFGEASSISGTDVEVGWLL